MSGARLDYTKSAIYYLLQQTNTQYIAGLLSEPCQSLWPISEQPVSSYEEELATHVSSILTCSGRRRSGRGWRCWMLTTIPARMLMMIWSVKDKLCLPLGDSSGPLLQWDLTWAQVRQDCSGSFGQLLEDKTLERIKVSLLDNISRKLSLRLSKMKVRQVYEYDWGIHAIL